MDIMMPEKNGLQIADELSNDSKYEDVPLIFLTAKDDSETLKQGFEAGARDYMKKPFDEMELRVRIESAIKIKSLENQLKIQSITDPLTKIYNRRYFYDNAVKELNRSDRNNETFCIVIADIDYFKKINDNYGHLAGDYILQEFAKKFSKVIRSYDILARYGGEEFIIMFTDCSKQKALEIMNRIKTDVETTVFKYEQHEIKLTFSAGIVASDECSKGSTIEQIIEKADKRLYTAKEKGRNKIVSE
jgi:diguanylate cyclase (GGDEF)-like protein